LYILVSKVRGCRLEPEPAPVQPEVHQLGVAVASEFEDVRRADLHGARFGGIGEVKLKRGASEAATFRNRSEEFQARRSALEKVVGFTRDHFARAVLPGDLDFAQGDFAEAGNAFRVERIGPVTALRFERVGATFGEPILAAAQTASEGRDVQVALALGAGVDANLVAGR
jgi:hypothetical protein